VFLLRLKNLSLEHSLLQQSYCLMTNHIHLVCIPKDKKALSATMDTLFGKYATYFNEKYGLNGHLWQGRYYSCPLDKQAFWDVVRYVERNPVRAAMTTYAEQYPWSSAAVHCGSTMDELVDPLPEFPCFIRSWSQWLREDEDPDLLRAIRRKTKTGVPHGPEEFLSALEKRLGRRLIPRCGSRPQE